MPNETYFLILEHRDAKPGVPYEEMEFTLVQDAWDAFRKFAEPASSEIYSEIELVRCIRWPGWLLNRMEVLRSETQ